MDPEDRMNPPIEEGMCVHTNWVPNVAPYEHRRRDPIPMPLYPPPPRPLSPSASAFYAVPPHIPNPIHRLDLSTYIALPQYRQDSTAPMLFPGNTPSGGSQNMTASSAGDMTTSAMPSSNASSYLIYSPGLSPLLISTQSAAPPEAWSVQQQAPRQFSGQENREVSQCLMSNPPLVTNESPELEAVTSRSSQQSSPDYCPIDPVATQPPPTVPFMHAVSHPREQTQGSYIPNVQPSCGIYPDSQSYPTIQAYPGNTQGGDGNDDAESYVPCHVQMPTQSLPPPQTSYGPGSSRLLHFPPNKSRRAKIFQCIKSAENKVNTYSGSSGERSVTNSSSTTVDCFTTTTSSLTVPSNNSSNFIASPASTISLMGHQRSLQLSLLLYERHFGKIPNLPLSKSRRTNDFQNASSVKQGSTDTESNGEKSVICSSSTPVGCFTTTTSSMMVHANNGSLCIGSPASTSLQMGHQNKMQLTKSLHLIPPPAPHSYQYSPLCSQSASNDLVDTLPAQPTPGNEAKPKPGLDLLSDVSLLVSRGSSGGSSNETAMCLPQVPYICPIPRDPDSTITTSTTAQVDNANMPPEGLEYTTMNTAVATDNLRSCPEGPLQNQYTLMLPSEKSIKFTKGLAEDPQSNSHDGLKKPSMFKKSLGGQPEKQALCAKNWGILTSDSSGSASALGDQCFMSSDIVTHVSEGDDSTNAVSKPEAQQSSTSYSSLAKPKAVIMPLGNQPHDRDALESMQTKIYPKLHFNPMEEKVTSTQPRDLTMVSSETTDQCTAKAVQKSTKAAHRRRLNSCMPSYSSHSSLPFKGCATKSASQSFCRICKNSMKDIKSQTECETCQVYSSSRQERGTEKGSKNNSSLFCEVCGQAFSSMNKLSRHQHQFHSSNFNEVPTGVHVRELSLDSPLSSFSISGTAPITSEANSQFSITPTISLSGPIPSTADMAWVETPSTSCNQPCPPVCQSRNKNLPTYNSEDCEKDNDVSNESEPKRKSAIQQSPHGQRELVLTCQDNSSSGYGQPAAPEPPKTKATATIIAASVRRIAPRYFYQSPPAVPDSSNAEPHHEQDKCPSSNADPEQDKIQVNFRTKKRKRINSKLHMGQYPYMCINCLSHFRSEMELLTHRTSHNIHRFPCFSCDLVFYKEDHLKAHMAQCHETVQASNEFGI